MKSDFFDKEGKFNIELLSSTLEKLVKDAEKCNKGVKAAGRRFRLKTVELEKAFKKMRKLSPKNEQ